MKWIYTKFPFKNLLLMIAHSLFGTLMCATQQAITKVTDDGYQKKKRIHFEQPGYNC